jgi:hypothetical protein
MFWRRHILKNGNSSNAGSCFKAGQPKRLLEKYRPRSSSIQVLNWTFIWAQIGYTCMYS